MTMKITGIKRWFVVILCALMAGIMVYVPFLRYSYYDQMCVLFTQYKQIVPAETVNTFIGDFGMAFGIVSMLGYPFGGIFADRFNEMAAYCRWRSHGGMLFLVRNSSR